MFYQFKTNQLAQYQVRSCLELQWYTFSSVLIIGQIILERCCIILGQPWVSSKLHLKCPHLGDHTCWHAAICPARLLWLHRWLNFTVKPWASRGIPSIYEWSCQVLEANLATVHSTVCHSQPALSHDCQTHTIVLSESYRVCCQCLYSLTLFHTDPPVWQ